MIAMQLPQGLEDVLARLLAEIAEMLPRVFLAFLAVTLITALGRVLNTYLRKLMEFAGVDETLERLFGQRPPVAASSLAVFLADLGLALIALYTVMLLLFPPELVTMVNEGLRYSIKLAGVLALILFLGAGYNLLVSRIRLETKLRGYIVFIFFLLTTAVLIDVVGLSDPVKSALVNGLSMGIGASIAIFAAWFFFSDYLEGLRRRGLEEAGEEQA